MWHPGHRELGLLIELLQQKEHSTTSKHKVTTFEIFISIIPQSPNNMFAIILTKSRHRWDQPGR